MSVRQQIIADRVDQTAKVLNIADPGAAFLRLSHSIVTGRSIHAFDESDLVDGGQDKQIDIITIDENDEEATVYIIQAKNTDSFSSNALIQMHNGLDWIFNKRQADLKQLSNTKFRDKVLSYRSVQTNLGPSNIRVIVVFATNGHTRDLSGEFRQEAKAIRREYADIYETFELSIWGCDELVEQINITEKRNKKIDADVTILYDANNPSVIKYRSHGLSGIVCSTTGGEIARIIEMDPSGFVFDSNVRKFLGSRGAVNADIHDTCTSEKDSHLFWFLNNGLTIACDHFDLNPNPDNACIKIKNMQIVNGCQTATSLAQAARDKKLMKNVSVLLRIYETSENTLVDKIVLTTNNQNKITSRDLRSNDSVQVDMQRRFERYGLHYERKPRQYDNEADVDVSRIAPNELVAQSYLAIVMKKPSDARRRKYKVWGELYERIFAANAVEPYIVSYLLYRLATSWLRALGNTASSHDMTRRLAKNGAFHIARIAAFLWRGNDEWRRASKQSIKGQIGTLESAPETLAPFFKSGLALFRKIITGNEQYASDTDRAMKSYILDADIDSRLHKPKRKRTRKGAQSRSRMTPRGRGRRGSFLTTNHRARHQFMPPFCPDREDEI